MRHRDRRKGAAVEVGPLLAAADHKSAGVYRAVHLAGDRTLHREREFTGNLTRRHKLIEIRGKCARGLSQPQLRQAVRASSVSAGIWMTVLSAG